MKKSLTSTCLKVFVSSCLAFNLAKESAATTTIPVAPLNDVYVNSQALSAASLFAHTMRDSWADFRTAHRTFNAGAQLKPYGVIVGSPWGKILLECLSGGVALPSMGSLDPEIRELVGLYPDLGELMKAPENTSEIINLVLLTVAPEMETNLLLIGPALELLDKLNTMSHLNDSGALQFIEEGLTQIRRRAARRHSRAFFRGFPIPVVLSEEAVETLAKDFIRGMPTLSHFLFTYRNPGTPRLEKFGNDLNHVHYILSKEHQNYNHLVSEAWPDYEHRPYAVLPDDAMLDFYRNLSVSCFWYLSFVVLTIGNFACGIPLFCYFCRALGDPRTRSANKFPWKAIIVPGMATVFMIWLIGLAPFDFAFEQEQLVFAVLCASLAPVFLGLAGIFLNERFTKAVYNVNPGPVEPTNVYPVIEQIARDYPKLTSGISLTADGHLRLQNILDAFLVAYGREEGFNRINELLAKVGLELTEGYHSRSAIIRGEDTVFEKVSRQAA